MTKPASTRVKQRLTLKADQGKITASWPGAIEPLQFDPPLSASDLADLTWYLEQYPLCSGMGSRYRAQVIRGRLEHWGGLLHRARQPPDAPHPLNGADVVELR